MTDRLTRLADSPEKRWTLRTAVAALVNGALLLLTTMDTGLTEQQWAIVFTMVNPALFIVAGALDSWRHR